MGTEQAIRVHTGRRHRYGAGHRVRKGARGRDLGGAGHALHALDCLHHRDRLLERLQARAMSGQQHAFLQPSANAPTLDA
eukprot:1972001-Rhodomonas_salina.1